MSGESFRIIRWFVMRDLKRRNASLPAWKMLGDAGFEVFTPLQEVLTVRGGIRKRILTPYIQDLLFVHSNRTTLDPVVEKTPTLQYRYAKGQGYMEPMVVPDRQMDDFIRAVRSGSAHKYMSPSEVTPAMLGRAIRVIGGPLDGMEGNLLSIRGSGKKRLYVQIPNLVAAAVEVSPEFIQVL